MRPIYVGTPIALIALLASCMSLQANRQTATLKPKTTPKILVRVLATPTKRTLVVAHTQRIQQELHPPQPTATSIPAQLIKSTPTDTVDSITRVSDVNPQPIAGVAVEALETISTSIVPEVPPVPTHDLPVTVDASNAIASNLGAASIDDVRARLLTLHNQARIEAGLAPYQISDQLQQAAQYQANYLSSKAASDLMNMGIAGHIGPDGERPSARALRFGYNGRVSENWAYYDNAQAAFDFWLTDPWHRPQVLSTELIEVGFGISTQPEFGTIFVAVYGRQ